MASMAQTSLHLTARGPNDQVAKTELREGAVTRIGRAPAKGWTIPWDKAISREHAEVQWQNGKLKVTCVPTATNPVVWRGQTWREILTGPDEEFRIGSTVFRQSVVQDEPVASSAIDETEVGFLKSDAAVDEYSYGENDLQQVKFSDPLRQMDLLANLPKMIASSTSDMDLSVKLVGLLLDAIPHAIAAAVVRYDESVVLQLRQERTAPINLSRPLLMRVQTRDTYSGQFDPSRRLLIHALRKNESIIHIWSSAADGAQFTLSESLDWAFCTPILDESCTGWCLYVAGEGARTSTLLVTEDDLKGDLRFTELLAQFIGSIRHVRLLQEQKTQLSLYFSPKVIKSLTGREATEVLKPSERNITVMFCDVRGFSKMAEDHRDKLDQFLELVRAALGTMTGVILEHDGTIADFQGDSALAFWGWPVALESGPVPACLAALSIQLQFNNLQPEDPRPLHGISVGIGIAHGRAIAGQIGTRHQAKVGVFGPVVNQGARLQGMSRQFGVDICIDEATADFVRQSIPTHQARVRKLACVLPKGMDVALNVSELLPPVSSACATTDLMIECHNAAVEAVITGQWTKALEILEPTPASGPKQFLLDRMAELGNCPPSDWNGSFTLNIK